MNIKITKEYIIEQAAEAIYHAGYQELDEISNVPHKLWESADPIDRQDEALAEHERDDFRREAEAAYDVFIKFYKTINKLIIKDIIE